MKYLSYVLLSVTFFCSGCKDNYKDNSVYQRTGGSKPIVAVMPMINSAPQSSSLTWDVAQELTEGIRARLFDSPRLYLLKEGGTLAVARQLSEPNPFILSEKVVDYLGAAEFVILTELIDQNEEIFPAPKKRPPQEEICGVLHLTTRVRVLDIRNHYPKVILQEVIEHEHPIEPSALHTDYEIAHWGTEAYERTPMGVIHNRLVREIVARVEGYIGASRL